MKRILGSGLVMALMLVLGSQASAQTPDDNLNGASVYGYAPYNQAYGGFGFEYTQVLPSNTYVLDRYWFVAQTPPVDTMAPTTATTAQGVAPARRAEPVQRVARVRSGKPARAVAKAGAKKSYQAAVQPMEPLPSGSLIWQGSTGSPLYSPALRSVNYGYGYDRSAFGSVDYGINYKGYYWGQ